MHTRSSLLSFLALVACSGSSSSSGSSTLVDSGVVVADASSTADADADAHAQDADRPTGPHAEVDGRIDGAPFGALGVAAKRFGWLRDSGAPGPGVSFAIGEYASMCATARPHLGRVLHFYLRGEGTGLLPTGRITIVSGSVLGGSGPAPQGTVIAARLSGADCGFAAVDDEATGTVEITRSDALGVTGSFELTFAKNGSMRGTFEAPYCAGASDATVACAL